MAATKIVDLTARDIRYPTSLQADGSDASHPDPDYSMVYVQLVTDNKAIKAGFIFVHQSAVQAQRN